MSAPQFESRWLITGTIVTKTELHIGDGGAARILDRNEPADEKSDQASIASDANTVCTDHRGRAYLPGSGIKGTLRELVTIPDPKDPKNNPPIIHPSWEALLGSDKPDSSDAVGGKVEFFDAFWREGDGPGSPDDKGESADDQTRPWWNQKRRTAVAVSVSLDRRTRTAKENLLYHLEYVPPGEKFDFEIGGDGLSDEEVARLLVLLDRLGDGTATLGAQASNDWGRVGIEDLKILRLDGEGMKRWKEAPTAPPKPQPIDEDTKKRIEIEKKRIEIPAAREVLEIVLNLHLESPWLIRDPRQRERSEAGKKNELAESDKPRDAVPIRDESGKPFVPAKSLRGALRSRAEMILRTLDLPCADHPGDIKAVSTKGKEVDDVTKLIREGDGEDVPPPDLAAKLFGLGGWRAPVHVPRFTATKTVADHRQEFVAIDRFTGGAAEHLKFNAELAGMTALTGSLTVDLTRLKKVDPQGASLGLLALVLRDLAEGDIPLGSGSAKGQGFCNATVTWGGKDLLGADCPAAEYLGTFRRLIPSPADPGRGEATA